MTLVAELRDSMTGEILARAVDARSARSRQHGHHQQGDEHG